MTGIKTGAYVVTSVEEAIRRKIEEIPMLKPVLNAFKEIFIVQAWLRIEISRLPAIPISPPDQFRFNQGVPLLNEEILCRFIDPRKEYYNFFWPALEKGFPKIRAEPKRLKGALEVGCLDTKYYLQAFVKGQEEEIEEIAVLLEIEPFILKFILEQLVKPLIEGRVERIK